MGSDNSGPRPVYHAARKRRKWFITIVFIAVVTAYCLPPPEVFFAETFDNQTELIGLAAVPPQCQSTLNHFYEIQKNSKRRAVLVCHRKYCASKLGGHCDSCMGLGDRMRTLLDGAERFTEAGVSVEIDFPVAHTLKLYKPSIYLDEGGWRAELLRYRSYVNRYKHEHMVDLPSKDGDVVYTRIQQASKNKQNFNICYFYALFRPSGYLQRAVERHENAIQQWYPDANSRSIGIHLRVGDFPAFGLNETGDVRASGAMEQSIYTMLDCADDLASKMWGLDQIYNVTYFFATDSEEIKQFIRGRQSEFPHVYTTDIQPSSFRSSNEDFEAWVEIFLLSQRQGIIANRVPEDYKGYAKYPRSLFAVLARKLGAMQDKQFLACPLMPA